MMKSKKGLSGVLAVLMLVSMLACFTLPVTAAEANENYYYVSSKKEWSTVAAAIKSDSKHGEGKTIIIQSDIDFGSEAPTQIENFAGTLDGNGYKFTNIVMNSDDDGGASLIKNLTGTIKDLTLADTCKFNNSASGLNYIIGVSYVNLGAFAATASGGTIIKCASYATYTATGKYVNVGGFVGTATGNVTIDGCIFDGAVTSSGTNGTANAFVGNPSTNLTINYSVARRELTATSQTGTDEVYFDEYSYAVDPAVESTTEAGMNGAVWLVNDQREQNVNDGIYLNVDGDGKPCFGNINNRVVRVSYEGLDNGPEPEYYAPRTKEVEGNDNLYQTRKDPSISGKVWEVSGAERRGDYFYIGSEKNVVVTYYDTTLVSRLTGEEYYTEYKISQTKAQLQAMVDAYSKMDPAYFTGAAFKDAKNAWLTKAMNALNTTVTFDEKEGVTAETTRIAEINALENQLQEIIKEADTTLDGYAIVPTDLQNYPSVKDYNTYKYINSFKDYKVESAEAWQAAVALSNYVENPNATNFSGITLHLTTNIDMGSAPMKPLCYGGVFDGNLDGHDNVFQNIKIEIDSSYGTVGLIGVLGENGARYVQNVGIESGSIKVTGWPRHKRVIRKTNYSHNCVGGIVGEYYKANSLIRKCWNNADISAENCMYLGGILGSGKENARVDSCFNLGYVEGYGILGYGHKSAITCNSMSGAVKSSAVQYRAYLVSDKTDDANGHTPEQRLINISGVKTTLSFDNFAKKDTDERKEEEAFQKAFNAENTEFSNAAAAWRVNANYVRQESYGNGERIYYTLNENGDVRFGDKSNQIYRIKMVCDQDGETCAEHPVRYAYGIAGQSIPLSFDIGANYFACGIEGVTINKENVLNFSKDIKIEVDESLKDKEKKEAAMTIPVYVDYNAYRGDVNGNNAVDVLDALDAVRMVVDMADPVFKTADVNSNHKVDINDVYRIICCALNLKGNGGFASGLPETRDQYLKVLSYNIKGCYYDPYYDTEDSNGTPFSRFGPIMDELKKIDADVMGFQEIVVGHSIYSAGEDVLERLCKSLNDWNTDPETTYQYHYAPSRYYTGDVNGPTAGSGIISKYPIIKSEIVLFGGNGWPGDPERDLDTSAVPRAFTWYQIDVDDEEGYQQGQDIIFYNTHLSTGYATNGIAAAQLQYMLEYMQEHHAEDRVVCTGDMNLGAYLVKNVIDKVNNPSDGDTSVTRKLIALNGDKNHNTYTRTNPNSGSMVDNIIVSEDVEYFKFGESKFSASPALNTSAALYGSDYSYGDMASYREAYKDYYDNDGGSHYRPVRDPSELEYDETTGEPTNGVSNEVYADNPQWTASDHMPIWAYIKK